MPDPDLDGVPLSTNEDIDGVPSKCVCVSVCVCVCVCTTNSFNFGTCDGFVDPPVYPKLLATCMLVGLAVLSSKVLTAVHTLECLPVLHTASDGVKACG